MGRKRGFWSNFCLPLQWAFLCSLCEYTKLGPAVFFLSHSSGKQNEERRWTQHFSSSHSKFFTFIIILACQFALHSHVPTSQMLVQSSVLLLLSCPSLCHCIWCCESARRDLGGLAPSPLLSGSCYSILYSWPSSLQWGGGGALLHKLEYSSASQLFLMSCLNLLSCSFNALVLALSLKTWKISPPLLLHGIPSYSWRWMDVHPPPSALVYSWLNIPRIIAFHDLCLCSPMLFFCSYITLPGSCSAGGLLRHLNLFLHVLLPNQVHAALFPMIFCIHAQNVTFVSTLGEG